MNKGIDDALILLDELQELKLYEREDLSARLIELIEYHFARQGSKTQEQKKASEIKKKLTYFEPKIKKEFTDDDRQAFLDKLLKQKQS